jgi:BirA family biotin operon repressor/biotin-[acetyl-CoA-carboxylase] ligase
MSRLGRPRWHRRETGSTSTDALALAAAGAPHGTLVTAGVQRAGRGRQGREWTTPPGQSLLMSVVLRSFDELLPLRAGLAAAEVCGPQALVKWPNDVLVGTRKVAGVLAEVLPREGCAVLGVGINVAVEVAELPAPLRDRAGTLGLVPEAVDDVLDRLLERLAIRLADGAETVLAALRERDALRGRLVTWSDGHGTATGLHHSGALTVDDAHGRRLVLRAGEVHLLPAEGVTVRR